MNDIKYFTQSLKTKERLKNIQKNKLIIPEMEIFESINGYDIDTTIKNLTNMKLRYKSLDANFETYGTLANFLTKLKDLHPSLTHNDLRLCAFLRLNLLSKEIAPLLNISVRSVEVKRYRLRKKLNMNRDDSISDYFINL